MTYEEIFNTVRERFADSDVSRIREHLAFQFNIEGEGEGAFYAEVKAGELFVEPYEYYDRDVLFSCTADTLLDIIDGKLDPLAAYNSKRLKVKGDLGKALRLKDMLKS